jgi:hypothetical protein
MPAMFMWAMSPDMSMPAIATLGEGAPGVAGIAHAKPLPAHNRWAKRKLARSAVSRRTWRMDLFKYKPQRTQ